MQLELVYISGNKLDEPCYKNTEHRKGRRRKEKKFKWMDRWEKCIDWLKEIEGKEWEWNQIFFGRNRILPNSFIEENSIEWETRYHKKVC